MYLSRADAIQAAEEFISAEQTWNRSNNHYTPMNAVQVTAEADPSNGSPHRLSGVVAFVGAGASVDAGVPLTWPLMDHIIDSCVPSEWAASALKQLSRHPRAGQRTPTDFLRLEELLDQIGKLLDDELRFLDFLTQFNAPGPMHRQLADGACFGLTIVTTNFDDLIERAISQTALSASTVHLAGESITAAPGAVYKLHGAMIEFVGGVPQLCEDPIVTTIGQLARQNAGFGREPDFADNLRELIRGKHLIVAGYSASDDLDVVPVLLTTTPSEATWIDHASGSVRTVKPRRPKWSVLLDHWSKFAEVRVRRGPTTRALGQLGLGAEREVALAAEMVPDWRKAIEDWAVEVRDRDPTGLGLASELFGHLERPDMQYRALKESEPGVHPVEGWSAGQRAYNIAVHGYLYDRSDEEVSDSLKEAQRWAVDASDADLQFRCQTLAARIVSYNDQFEDAIGLFGELVSSASGIDQLGYAKAWLGRVHFYSGDPSAALPHLREAEPLVSEAGSLVDLSLLMDLLTARAYAELVTDNIKDALRAVLRLRTVAASISDGRRLCQALTIEAQIHAFGGDAQAAVTAAKHAVEVGTAVKHSELEEALDVLGSSEAQAGFPRRSVRRYLVALQLARASHRRSWFRAALAASRLSCGYCRAAERAARNALSEQEVDPGAELLATVVLCDLGITNKQAVEMLAHEWEPPHPPALVLMADHLVRCSVRTPSLEEIIDSALDARSVLLKRGPLDTREVAQ